MIQIHNGTSTFAGSGVAAGEELDSVSTSVDVIVDVVAGVDSKRALGVIAAIVVSSYLTVVLALSSARSAVASCVGEPGS